MVTGLLDTYSIFCILILCVNVCAGVLTGSRQALLTPLCSGEDDATTRRLQREEKSDQNKRTSILTKRVKIRNRTSVQLCPLCCNAAAGARAQARAEWKRKSMPMRVCTSPGASFCARRYAAVKAG